jgi:hybrid polyketide synthase / nonribosomal peptide synthetase ACE1
METAQSQILSSGADDLGIDSLVAVEVRSWFLKELEIDMPVLKILSGGSIADLLSFSVEKLPAELTPRLGTVTSPILPSSEAEPQKVEMIPAASTDPVLSDTATSKTSDSGAEEDQHSSVTSGSRGLVKSTTVARPDNFEKVLPMSPGQSRFWFLKHFLEDQTTTNVTFTVKIKGGIRLYDLEKAIEQMGNRHEALRTCFFTDENQRPMQGVFGRSLLRLEKASIKDQSQVIQEFESMKNYVYDIGRGETMRVVHLSLTPSLSFLIIGYHHINMDGISLEVFLNDLERAYNHQALPQPVYQYTEFSTKQRDELERGEMKDELQYWRSELADHPAPLPLLPFSSTKSRTPVGNYDHNIESRRVDPTLARQIKAMCQKQKANIFHFYLAVFEVLLFKLLDTSDLCIGMADANRNDDKVAKSMGMYLNLLPLRFRLGASQTFGDVLKATRKKAYSAMAHSRLPFDILLEEIKAPRNTSHSPLFQAFINYRQGVSEKRKFGDSETEGGDYALGRTGYDLSIDILDNPGGETLVTFIVQKQLYSNGDAKKLVEMYFNLLKHFSASPSSSLDQASLFVAEDINHALGLGRGTYLFRW